MKKTYTKEELQAYVGRKFILQKTKYGTLDGHVGMVTQVMEIPALDLKTREMIQKPVLSIKVPTSEFLGGGEAIVLPTAFSSEVK